MVLIYQIVINVGQNGDVVIVGMCSSGQGFNVLSGVYEDLMVVGIVDVVKVVCLVVQDLILIVFLLIIIEVVIVDKLEFFVLVFSGDGDFMGGMGGMGGMGMFGMGGMGMFGMM